MEILKDTVVTLDYSIADTEGILLDEGRTAVSYLHGGYDDIFPRIEEALQGKTIGDTVVVKLQPAEAFGEYDANLVQIELRQNFPPKLSIGMEVQSHYQDHVIVYRVTDITHNKVILDGNHPLAGNALVFTCTVTHIRPAATQEIMHQHVRGLENKKRTLH